METPEERRARWLSVSVAPSATPSRNGGARAAEVNATERRWDRDGEAYKAMRAQGLQPHRLDGAADMAARATSAVEIETGQIMADKTFRSAMESVHAGETD